MSGEPLTDETIAQLLDGELPWEEVQNEILPDPKDSGRFEKVRAILQERVNWDEPILLPLNDHLFVVSDEGEYVVKTKCGESLCALEDNWKLQTQVRVREDQEELTEIYPKLMGPDPDWSFQVREYFCPGCYELLDVTAVPAGYPMFQPFRPDVDTLYEDWLDEPVPGTADD